MNINANPTTSNAILLIRNSIYLLLIETSVFKLSYNSNNELITGKI